jgi:tRNA (guanine-N7-)-methyltransferase
MRDPMNDPTTIRRLYGRRTGHKLRQGQSQLVDRLLPEISVPEAGPVTAETLFGDDRPLELEIGFGRGEHMVGQAMMRPGHGFIGCEPFLDGVVGALLKIDEQGIDNIRIHMGDALEVLERLPDASLGRAYLLHPDPWPKARHAKRRFMNAGPIAMIAQKLKPGAEFRFGTDHPVYVRWAMMVMGQSPDFEWLGEKPADFLIRPDDWPETRYEAKARTKGHEVWYMKYRRI